MKVQERQLLVVGPGEGRSITLGKGIGVDFKIWGHQTGGRFAIVEHPIEARRLVPPHTHSMEDELSYVLEGQVGVRVGDDVAEAGPGTYIYKPSGVPHTFWNPTDQPARLLELICKAGFEDYFVQLSELIGSGSLPNSPERNAASAHHHVTYSMDWVPELKAKHGLKLLGEP
jgi:quercetin dioxygenase-like cupin family protein